MALHHFATSLCDTQVDATKIPTMTWHTHSLNHSFFSRISCSTRSRLHIFRNQDEQFVFASFRRRNHHLLCHQASTNHNLSRQVGPRPLDQAPAIPRSLMQASHLFDAGHVQMQHGVEPQAWSVHVRPQ